MAAILRVFFRTEAVQIEKITEKEEFNRVQCPDCDYQMPIFYGENANCSGVMVPCKGRNCHAFFEIKIKDGKQIK